MSGTTTRSTPVAAAFSGPAAQRALAGFGVVALGVVCGYLTANVNPAAGYALLLGLLFAGAVLRRPQLGVLGVAAVVYLLPFGVMPVALGGVKLTFVDVTLTLALGAWLLRLLAGSREAVLAGRAGPAVLAFLGIMITALLFSQESVSAEVFRLFLKGVNGVLLYFTVVNLFRRPGDLVLLARGVMLAAGGAGTIAVGLYVLPAARANELLGMLGRIGYPSSDKVLRYIADTDTLRAIGTAVDPNVLGGMLTIVTPLLAVQLVTERPLLRRWVVAVLFGLVVAALALTYSRGAWFGAAVGLAYLGVTRYQRWAAWGALMGVAGAVSPPGQQFLSRFFSGVTFADRAAQMRLGEYKDALRLISQYPVFGVGFGSAPSLDLYVGSSSIYLLMASQTGLVGTSIFLVAMAVLLRQSHDVLVRRPGGPVEPVLRGATAGLLGALAAGLFDHYFFNLQFPHAIALFWLFCGMVAASASVLELPGAEAAMPATSAAARRAPSPALPR